MKYLLLIILIISVSGCSHLELRADSACDPSTRKPVNTSDYTQGWTYA